MTPANGYQNTPTDQAARAQSGGADAEYWHGPAYGSAVTNNGSADCEWGQRGYPLMLNHADPHHRAWETDAKTPGAQGTTWTGRRHVPAGETFSRNPDYGPQVPNFAGNPR